MEDLVKWYTNAKVEPVNKTDTNVTDKHDKDKEKRRTSKITLIDVLS